MRIKSILKKLFEIDPNFKLEEANIQSPSSDSERDLMLKITQFNDVILNSFLDYSPNKICQFIYELSNEFNRFYRDNRIISEKDVLKQYSWLKLIILAKDILTTCLDLLAIEVPERM